MDSGVTMPDFHFVVVVTCETMEQAEQVMMERILHDEDYGFDYEIDYDKK